MSADPLVVANDLIRNLRGSFSTRRACRELLLGWSPQTGFVAKGVQILPAKVEVLRLIIKTGEVDSVKPSHST